MEECQEQTPGGAGRGRQGSLGLETGARLKLYEVIDGEAREVTPLGFVANLFAFRLGVALDRFRQSARDVVIVEGLFALPAPVNRRPEGALRKELPRRLAPKP